MAARGFKERVGIKERVRRLGRDTYALFFALGSPRVPWYAKALAALIVAYALSPIDLIPDFIPVLGLLDDLLIVPLGLAIVVKLVPREVMIECRERAERGMEGGKPKVVVGAGLVVLLWGAAVYAAVRTVVKLM